MQPPAGLPRRAPQVSGPLPRVPGGRPGGGASPPMPRNYSPGGPGGDSGSGPGGGIGRARIREAPFGAAPAEAATRPRPGPPAAPSREPWYQVVGDSPAARQLSGQPAAAAGDSAARGAARGPAREAAARGAAARAAAAQAAQAAQAAVTSAVPATREMPPHARGPAGKPAVTADGRRNCGPLESILRRQWDASSAPPAAVVSAIDRLAEFPRALQEKLALGLDGIYVGAGGVPDLDDMSALHGVPLPSGKATWDACAGAYGDRKIVVGTRPSPTPDVMCHEVGHALDDLDSPPGKWQSDSAEFRLIYDQCQPFIASDFHRQRGGLGRKEFFADAFAAIASAQRPALVDMLSGNTRIALRVMLYFNRRYGI